MCGARCVRHERARGPETCARVFAFVMILYFSLQGAPTRHPNSLTPTAGCVVAKAKRARAAPDTHMPESSNRDRSYHHTRSNLSSHTDQDGPASARAQTITRQPGRLTLTHVSLSCRHAARCGPQDGARAALRAEGALNILDHIYMPEFTCSSSRALGSRAPWAARPSQASAHRPPRRRARSGCTRASSAPAWCAP